MNTKEQKKDSVELIQENFAAVKSQENKPIRLVSLDKHLSRLTNIEFEGFICELIKRRQLINMNNSINEKVFNMLC